ncbi:hypothetical protein AgCh_009742 [Apium graveolens]
MISLLASNPVLPSPFLGYKLSSGNFKRLAPNRVCLAPRNFKAKCTMDTSYGGGNVSKFPRSSVWDPYKRLGISTDASEEEVWSARNFLLDQYAGHERNVESIEAAFEKILMTSFLKRKKTKINLKSRLKKKVEESPPWVKNLISFVELPPNVIIIRRLFLFAFMACWSVNSPAEGGPAFQVCSISSSSMYFSFSKS